MSTELIVALDYADKVQALKLLQHIDPHRCAVKVGSEMFTLFGTDFVSSLTRQGYRVFLDLKFHDIPNTVAHACKAAADLGVWMLNLHAMGGRAMMQAASNALAHQQGTRPHLIAVTVLTSMTDIDLPCIGIEGTVAQQVARLASLTRESGLDGVVCSAHEVKAIKAVGGEDFLTITPGIRLADDSMDDQSRVVTPSHAKALGSDFIVVGRPITRALNPQEVINQILQTLSFCHHE